MNMEQVQAACGAVTPRDMAIEVIYVTARHDSKVDGVLLKPDSQTVGDSIEFALWSERDGRSWTLKISGNDTIQHAQKGWEPFVGFLYNEFRCAMLSSNLEL